MKTQQAPKQGQQKEAPNFTALVTAETAKEVANLANRCFVTEPVMAGLLADIGEMVLGSEQLAQQLGQSTGGILRDMFAAVPSSSGSIAVAVAGCEEYDLLIDANIYRRTVEEWLGHLIELGLRASSVPEMIERRIKIIGQFQVLARFRAEAIRRDAEKHKPQPPPAFFKFERALAADHRKEGVKP